MNDLIKNIDKIHTTFLGEKRIRRNINVDGNVLVFCQEIIQNKQSKIILKGKNYYVTSDNIIITINKGSYTIITAHQKWVNYIYEIKRHVLFFLLSKSML